jgi:hypothetical protein
MPFAEPAENRGGVGDAIGPDVSGTAEGRSVPLK